MDAYGRALKGAEAGAIAAAVVEISFFVLDLIRLQPLATPIALSGTVPGSGGVTVDLSSLSGVVDGLWVVYQIGMLTFAHFVAFGLVGVLVSFLFDWSRPGLGRLVVVAGLCTAAFYATVAVSSSLVALESVGWPLLIGMNLLAAAVLGGSLRLVSQAVPVADPTG